MAARWIADRPKHWVALLHADVNQGERLLIRWHRASFEVQAQRATKCKSKQFKQQSSFF